VHNVTQDGGFFRQRIGSFFFSLLVLANLLSPESLFVVAEPIASHATRPNPNHVIPFLSPPGVFFAPSDPIRTLHSLTSMLNTVQAFVQLAVALPDIASQTFPHGFLADARRVGLPVACLSISECRLCFLPTQPHGHHQLLLWMRVSNIAMARGPFPFFFFLFGAHARKSTRGGFLVCAVLLLSVRPNSNLTPPYSLGGPGPGRPDTPSTHEPF